MNDDVTLVLVRQTTRTLPTLIEAPAYVPNLKPGASVMWGNGAFGRVLKVARYSTDIHTGREKLELTLEAINAETPLQRLAGIFVPISDNADWCDSAYWLELNHSEVTGGASDD